MDENWDDDNYAPPQRNSYAQRHNGTYGNNGTSYSNDNSGRSSNRNERRSDTWRSRDRYDDEPKSSAHRFQKSLDIESSSIGLIIGRGGANIKHIQRKFNVNVKVDRSSNLVNISGNDESRCDDATQHIRDQIDKSNESNNDGHNRGLNRGDRRENKNYNSDSYNTKDNYSTNYDKHDSEKYNDDNGYNRPLHSDDPFDSCSIDWDALNKKAVVEREKRWAKCPPLTKNFYKEVEEVAKLSADEVECIRKENNNITVSRVFANELNGSDIPKPIWKFEQCFEQYPDLMEEIRKQQFEQPSPIQSQAWPVLLKGEDLIGIAQTGTGKTLAFLLPAMIHTEYQSTPRSERGGPNVLVMAPTRELALQIEKEVNKYSFRGMKAVCVYGGGNRRDQIDNVKNGVEIIICTPGRLNDLIEAKVIDVASVTFLILDEADRMLDMGFEPQIRKVLLDIRPDRQTVMTSATWPPGVRRLAQSYMNNPIQVCVGSLDLAATHTVQQIVEIVNEDDKYFTVRKFLKNMESGEKAIVFCGKKARADDLSSELSIEGVLCQCIHGSREQSDREQAIADIKSGEVKVLIATDVASRGLDIEDITHVINFDFPRNIEEYVHRVGRTGRAGRTGVSISYITREDWAMAQELIDILEEADQDVPNELRDMATRFKAMKERRANENAKFDNNYRGDRNGRGGNYGRSDGRRDRRDRF